MCARFCNQYEAGLVGFLDRVKVGIAAHAAAALPRTHIFPCCVCAFWTETKIGALLMQRHRGCSDSTASPQALILGLSLFKIAVGIKNKPA